ncbi:MAG: response regulator [Deltaproteobacteria bacterium]|nr:MAG: response regulator [Deltaproteobacteria bacterium]
MSRVPTVGDARPTRGWVGPTSTAVSDPSTFGAYVFPREGRCTNPRSARAWSALMGTTAPSRRGGERNQSCSQRNRRTLTEPTTLCRSACEVRDRPPPGPFWAGPNDRGDLETTSRVQAVAMWVGILVLAGLASSLPFLDGQLAATLPVYLGTMALCAVGLWLVRTGRHGLPSQVFTLVYWAFTSASLFQLGGLDNPAVGGGFVTTILVALLFWGGQGALGIALLDSIVVAVFIAAHQGDTVPQVADHFGLRHWAEISSQVAVVAVLGYVMLRTIERSRAENLAQEAQLLAIIEENPDGLVVLDEQGFVRMCNHAAQTVLEEDGLVGKRLSDLATVPDDVRAALQECIAVQAHEHLEMTLSRETGGSRTVEWRFGGIRSHVGVVLGTVRDVTERKRREALHKELEARADEARHLEALGRLAGGVAHDFNNLLSVILGNAELAQHTTADQNAELTAIIDSANHAAALTSRMLAFGRRQPDGEERSDFRNALADMRRLLDRLLETHIHLDIQVPEQPVWVPVARSSLEQIVINLVTNARDSLRGQGGAIRVFLDLESRHDQTWARLKVEDNGVGMDEDTRRRVFEPFFTTKPLGRGTGLGLATVHGIVVRNEGKVEVESSPGIGTSIVVFLPLTASPVASRDPEASTAEVPRLSVLVAEDEDSVRALLVTMLQMAGHEVAAFDNGALALEHFLANARGFDMLVTDLVMPRMGGFELARAVRDARPDLPILFISGYSPEESPEIPESVAFLAKPFDPRAFLEGIRRAWDERPESTRRPAASK